jgi:hypothetical protein
MEKIMKIFIVTILVLIMPIALSENSPPDQAQNMMAITVQPAIELQPDAITNNFANSGIANIDLVNQLKSQSLIQTQYMTAQYVTVGDMEPNPVWGNGRTQGEICAGSQFSDCITSSVNRIDLATLFTNGRTQGEMFISRQVFEVQMSGCYYGTALQPAGTYNSTFNTRQYCEKANYTGITRYDAQHYVLPVT